MPKRQTLEQKRSIEKLNLRVLEIAIKYDPVVRRDIRAKYTVALEDNRKNAVLFTLRKAFPKEDAGLKRLKSFVLGGQRTIRAEQWRLFAWGEFPKCHVCGSAMTTGIRKDLGIEMCSHECSRSYAITRATKVMKKEHGVSNYFASKEFKENLTKFYEKKHGKGVTAPLLVPGAQDKVRKTSLERYGVEHWGKSPKVIQKRMDTNMKMYGATTALHGKGGHEKTRLASLRRFGVEHNSQSQEVKQRKVATSRRRYGTDNPLQHPDIRAKIVATSVKNFGVRHLMQLPGEFERRQKASLTHSVVWRNEKTINCQGYEPQVLNELEKDCRISKVTCKKSFIGTVRYLKPGREKDRWSVYYPDFAVLTHKKKVVVAEVKSIFTLGCPGDVRFETNSRKFKAAVKHYRTLDWDFVVYLRHKGVNHLIRDPHLRLSAKVRSLLN